MRPQVDDKTAEVLEQLAEEQTKVDTEMLTFDQKLRVVLQNVGDIETATGRGEARRPTQEGRIIAEL